MASLPPLNVSMTEACNAMKVDTICGFVVKLLNFMVFLD